MDPACLRALIDLRVELLRGICCDDQLVDHLTATRVLAEEQRQHVMHWPSAEEQNRCLLDLLPKLSDCAWTELLRGLQKSGSETHRTLAKVLEQRAKRAPMSPNQPSNALLSGTRIDNPDERESTIASPSSVLSPHPVQYPGYTSERLPAVPNLMTTSAYFPRAPSSAMDPLHNQISTSVGHWGRGHVSMPAPQRLYGPAGRGAALQPGFFQPQVSTTSTGLDFQSLSDSELQEVADQLSGRIGFGFPRFVNTLLCSIPKFRHGAAFELKTFQRESSFQDELYALIKLWLRDSAEPCTGQKFYEALRPLGEGTAAQCRDILQLPPR